MTTVPHPKKMIYHKPGMMTTLTTFEHVSRSPSKNKYSFCKVQNRFMSVRKMQDQQYTLPTTKGRRAAGFGYGERFIDTPLRLQTPSPDRYLIPDLYHQKGHINQAKENHIKNKTFAFGAGRDNY